jgi:predicted glutamine amidotransferase
MCRFLAYRGQPVLLHDLLYRPAHSLVEQSCRAREQDEHLNPDGFGVAWYVPELSPFPAVVRSLLPAWSNESLKSLSRLTRSPCVFAHVRNASEGLEVSEANCHPFQAGSLLWMHNGGLAGYAGFRDWARRYLSRAAFAQIRGTTDSELLFALFLDLWAEAGSPADPEGLLGAFRKTLRLTADILESSGVRDASRLNIALTDGRTILASRHLLGPDERPNSLYLAKEVRIATGRDALALDRDPQARNVLIASEPILPSPAWEEVPAGSIAVVREDGRASCEPTG